MAQMIELLETRRKLARMLEEAKQAKLQQKNS